MILHWTAPRCIGNPGLCKAREAVSEAGPLFPSSAPCVSPILSKTNHSSQMSPSPNGRVEKNSSSLKQQATKPRNTTVSPANCVTVDHKLSELTLSSEAGWKMGKITGTWEKEMAHLPCGLTEAHDRVSA